MGNLRCKLGVGLGLSGLLLIGGCGGDGDRDPAAPEPPIRAHFVQAPVEGGSCSLFDARGPLVSGPARTVAGRVGFDLKLAAGTQLMLSCSGGTYLDPATGQTQTAPMLRTLFEVQADHTDVVASPVTELAVRLLGGAPTSGFNALLGKVATSLGLEGVAVARLLPKDLNVGAPGEGPEARYGLALAALSQMQLAIGSGNSLDALLGRFAGALDASAQYRGGEMRDDYLEAIDQLLANARLRARFDGTSTRTLDALFDAVAQLHVTPEITYVDTDPYLNDEDLDEYEVFADRPTTISILGRDLYLGLEVLLGGRRCLTHDVSGIDEEEDTDEQEMLADCPAYGLGATTLDIFDKGQRIASQKITVVPRPLEAQGGRKRRLNAVLGTGPATVYGQVIAVAPTFDTAPGGNGGMKYDVLRSFAVKGVVVELLNRDAGNEVLGSTSTDGEGNYRFSGVESGVGVVVRVKAQLLKEASENSPSNWNFTVRDNTSATSPKALYALDSAPLVTASGENVVNVRAGLGFDAAGNELPDPTSARQSAPFSILEVIYSAATKIQVTDPGVSLPELNVYWSPKNIGAPGDKNLGQIQTSHYTASGALPGVFILGKADVDTDEFDQGVIGHEFGHYLQSVLSYADNPGGSHANGEFKDASLAYGEGYGTAVGGLLAGSPYYIDSSGPRQAAASVANLNEPSPGGRRKGFYSEESVGHVMYRLGVQFGFGSFWKAVSTMRTGHESATLSRFLGLFMEQNPDAQGVVTQLMQTENIRSADALGRLPAGTPADPAIDANASKGAIDLEQLYLSLSLTSDSANGGAVNVTPNAPAFCVNNNLPGANNSNGLGMLRRFTFTAPFSGGLGLRPIDDSNAPFNDQNTNISARDSSGANVGVYGWDGGYGMINVVAGRSYTVRVEVVNPESVLGGNRCNNKLTLYRLAAA